MKKLLFASILSILSVTAFAQGEAPIGKGGKMLNFGITGFGNSLPVYGSLEFGVHDDITVGPIAAINFFSGDNTLRIGAIGNYHWNRLIGIPSNWDFYAGLNAGWRINFDNDKNSGFAFGGQVGGRWFWSDKWGLNAEFGFAGAVGGGLGLTIKM